MVQAGFSPLNLQSLNVSAMKSTPDKTYRHEKGGLQVGVGFNDLGAKLRLTLTGPDGKKIEHEDEGTFLVEVPNAAPGQWHYSVRAAAVPFEHFPLVLAVGKTK
jgi:hypothetical protein